jgi:hypothetical protein
MQIALEVHLGVAFLVVLCAIVFSWNNLGRRVVNAVAGLQVLIGLVAAGIIGAEHLPMPPALGLHVAVAIVILACYGMASRFGRRPGGGGRALVLSAIGLIAVLYNVYLGWHMVLAGQA